MTERIRTLLTFLAADPGDTFSRFALAMEHKKAGDIESAAEALEEVIRRDPAYIGAYYHLGKMRFSEARYLEAKELYDKGLQAAESKGEAHEARELRQALAELEMEME